MEPQAYLYITNQMEMYEHVGTVDTSPQQIMPEGETKWFFLVDRAAYQKAKLGMKQILLNPTNHLFQFPTIEESEEWVELSYHDLLYVRWLEILDWVKAHPKVIDSVRLDQHPFTIKASEPEQIQEIESQPETETQTIIRVKSKKSTKSKDKQYYRKLDLFE